MFKGMLVVTPSTLGAFKAGFRFIYFSLAYYFLDAGWDFCQSLILHVSALKFTETE